MATSHLSEFQKQFDEGGRRTRRRIRRKVRKTAPETENPAIAAYLNANTEFAAKEAARPNKCYTLKNPAGANAAVAAGASIDCTLSLQNDTWIVDILCTLQNNEDFVCDSLKFASYDVVSDGPCNLESFRSTMNREHRPTPLQGRLFRAGQTITARFTCVSDAVSAKFKGLTLWVIEETCIKTDRSTKAAPNVMTLGAMHRVLGNATMVPRRRSTNALRG